MALNVDANGPAAPDLLSLELDDPEVRVPRRIEAVRRVALSAEIHSGEQLVETRIGVKRSEVLASDPQWEIRIALLNGCFSKRQR